MRKIKEVIRLKWEQRLTNRAIARSCSIGRSTVGEYLRRAAAAGLSWPLPEELDEAELERKLFPPPPLIPFELRPRKIMGHPITIRSREKVPLQKK